MTTPFDEILLLTEADEEIPIAKDYSIEIAYLQVPNAFAINVGSAASAVAIMQKYPANTRFRLLVNGVAVFAGRTDGFARANQGATELAIRGRDAMAYIVDSYAANDKSFSNATFEELVRYAIEKSAGVGRADYDLTYDVEAQRKAVSGTPIIGDATIKEKFRTQELDVVTTNKAVYEQAIFEGRPIELKYTTVIRTGETTIERTVKRVTGYRSDNPIQIKAGESYYSWLKKELDRGGVFLRAGVDTSPGGTRELTFLVGAPNAEQAPTFALVNVRGQIEGDHFSNVMQPRIEENNVGRYAYYEVLGQAGTGKDGRRQIRAEYVDQEMLDRGYGWKRKVWKHDFVKSKEHAEYLARRYCAEARRASRVLVYPVPRHSGPLLLDPSKRGTFAPDLTVYLRDDEHGIDDVFWIERVSMRGSSTSGSMTELTLMSPEDLLFGEGGFDPARKGGGKRKVFGKDV